MFKQDCYDVAALLSHSMRIFVPFCNFIAYDYGTTYYCLLFVVAHIIAYCLWYHIVFFIAYGAHIIAYCP